MDFQNEIENLDVLANSLKETKDLRGKQELLISYHLVAQMLALKKLHYLLEYTPDLRSKIALFAVAAVRQHEIIFHYPEEELPQKKIRHLLSQLVAVERFYESIGGIVGYHVQVLKRLFPSLKSDATSISFSRSPGIELAHPNKEVKEAVWAGLRCLNELGEIYPLGGLGSRLNLMTKTSEALPVAFLPYAGRTLLEGLIRDVQAREFLYYRLFQKQVTIPIALMGSSEKNNMERVRLLCEKKKWFGRSCESFKLFTQISVPVVTMEGKWSMKGALELNLQPGGHGALWKAAEENGIFFWFQDHDKCRLLIRQINNPIAGIDLGLLALVGIGKTQKKIFGFASCERLTHAAEGVLVLVTDENGNRRISNIEYTDFAKYGIEDRAVNEGFSLYPANTNILYADLNQIVSILRKTPLHGLTLNMKNKEPFFCSSGVRKEIQGGRLESMMQNISDALVAKSNEPLLTFLTYNDRRKTISATKRGFESGKSLLETPEGSFYDLLYNAHQLLEKVCGVRVPPFNSAEEYLQLGPSLLFLYHPALGPLYDLIAQKIKGGVFAVNAELNLEIADLILHHVNLEGSLIIQAKNLLGHDSQGIIRYSQKTGKCVLKNVTIQNKGIDRKRTVHYWKNQIQRDQALKIILQGHSEFYAENVVFEGENTFIVPHGERWIVYQKPDHLNFELSYPDSEEMATQTLRSSGCVNDQRSFMSQASTRDVSRLPKSEEVKAKTQVDRTIQIRSEKVGWNWVYKEREGEIILEI